MLDKANKTQEFLEREMPNIIKNVSLPCPVVSGHTPNSFTKTSLYTGKPNLVWLLILLAFPECLLHPWVPPSLMASLARDWGWGEAFSPVAAGLRWSESPGPDMEGTWGMEGAGGATFQLCAGPSRRHWPSWSSCWISLRPTFRGPRAG